MMIYDCFLVTLATLIEEHRYKQEFACANDLLNNLMELYPEIPKLELQHFILFSYETHNEPLSVVKRFRYMKMVLALSCYEDMYGPYISDFQKEVKSRKQFCRACFDSKLSRADKTAIGEITYYEYCDQLRTERELLYQLPPCLIKQ